MRRVENLLGFPSDKRLPMGGNVKCRDAATDLPITAVKALKG